MPNLDPETELLLSGYLDDAVTPAERARVESLVRTDPSVAADLQSLVELRQALGRLGQQSHRRLPADFADRVLQAATQRARLEGCRHDHPLMLMSQSPLTSVGATSDDTISKETTSGVAVPDRRRRRSVAAAGLLLATAASLGLAIWWWPADPTVDVAVRMAAPEVVSRPDAVADSGDPAVVRPTPAVVPSGANRAVPPSEAGRGASQPDRTTPADGDDPPQPLMQSDRDVSESIAGTGRPADDRVADADTEAVAGMADRVNEQADRVNEQADRVNELADANTDPAGPSPVGNAAIGLKAVLVLDIRLQDPAVGLGPIREAMSMVGLSRSNEQALRSEMVAPVTAAVDQPGMSGSLMYLRAPAKQIDRLIFHLLADERQVASVGLGIATQTPLIELADQMAEVDPTQVRHDLASVAGGRRQAGRVTDDLAACVFVPLSRDAGATSGDAGASPTGLGADSGPDVIANAFLLVR